MSPSRSSVWARERSSSTQYSVPGTQYPERPARRRPFAFLWRGRPPAAAVDFPLTRSPDHPINRFPPSQLLCRRTRLIPVRRSRCPSREPEKDQITTGGGEEGEVKPFFVSAFVLISSLLFLIVFPFPCFSSSPPLLLSLFDLLYPGGHFSGLPPSRCRWRWKTLCPAPGPTLYTVRYPCSMPRSRAIFAAASWQ